MTIKRRTATHQRNMNDDMYILEKVLSEPDWFCQKNKFGQHLSFINSVLRTAFKSLVSVQAAQAAMYVWEFEPVEDGSEVKHIPH